MQMTLDLFPTVEKTRADHCIEYMRSLCRGFDDDGERFVRHLFDTEERYQRIYYRTGIIENVRFEAYERCKALEAVYNFKLITLQGLSDYMDIFNPHIDYHVIWDRKWALMKGAPLESLGAIVRYDYSNQEPITREEQCDY